MDPKFLAAEELGIRLEIVGGLPIWEAHPLYRHQKAVDTIRQSIRNAPGPGACSCVHIADVYIQFPEGSLKRPDIALFCSEPQELDEAIQQIPEAVIEVISKGYEVKDLEIAPPFYLAQGVKDVVVFDPIALTARHFRRDGATQGTSPKALQLECGCEVTV
jgi:Uma2 family endonuclease